MSIGERIGGEGKDDQWRIVQSSATGRFHVQWLDIDGIEEWTDRGDFEKLETAIEHVQQSRAATDSLIGEVVWES